MRPIKIDCYVSAKVSNIIQNLARRFQVIFIHNKMKFEACELLRAEIVIEKNN